MLRTLIVMPRRQFSASSHGIATGLPSTTSMRSSRPIVAASGQEVAGSGGTMSDGGLFAVGCGPNGVLAGAQASTDRMGKATKHGVNCPVSHPARPVEVGLDHIKGSPVRSWQCGQDRIDAVA